MKLAARIILIPFLLAFAFACGAGLLGYWQPEPWRWVLCLVGLPLSLLLVWEVVRK